MLTNLDGLGVEERENENNDDDFFLFEKCNIDDGRT
jgi:hypothetical protein